MYEQNLESVLIQYYKARKTLPGYTALLEKENALMKYIHSSVFNSQQFTSYISKICQRIVKKYPDHSPAWLILSWERIRSNSLKQAEDYVRKSIQIDADSKLAQSTLDHVNKLK
jgi:hypothetical protein